MASLNPVYFQWNNDTDEVITGTLKTSYDWVVDKPAYPIPPYTKGMITVLQPLLPYTDQQFNLEYHNQNVAGVFRVEMLPGEYQYIYATTGDAYLSPYTVGDITVYLITMYGKAKENVA